MKKLSEYADFAEWLQDQLETEGISQAELARRSGVTSGAINNIARDRREPTADMCLAIAKGLRLPAIDVLRVAGYLPIVDEPVTDTYKKILEKTRLLDESERLLILDVVNAFYNRKEEEENKS